MDIETCRDLQVSPTSTAREYLLGRTCQISFVVSSFSRLSFSRLCSPELPAGGEHISVEVVEPLNYNSA